MSRIIGKSFILSIFPNEDLRKFLNIKPINYKTNNIK